MGLWVRMERYFLLLRHQATAQCFKRGGWTSSFSQSARTYPPRIDFHLLSRSAGWWSDSSVISLPVARSSFVRPCGARFLDPLRIFWDLWVVLTFKVSLAFRASYLGTWLNKLPPSGCLLTKLKGITLQTTALVFGLLQQHLLWPCSGKNFHTSLTSRPFALRCLDTKECFNSWSTTLLHPALPSSPGYLRCTQWRQEDGVLFWQCPSVSVFLSDSPVCLFFTDLKQRELPAFIVRLL